jgi:hypothetical protein
VGAAARFQDTRKITVGYIAIAGALATSSWMLKSSPSIEDEHNARHLGIVSSSVLALSMGRQAILSSAAPGSMWLAGAVAAGAVATIHMSKEGYTEFLIGEGFGLSKEQIKKVKGATDAMDGNEMKGKEGSNLAENPQGGERTGEGLVYIRAKTLVELIEDEARLREQQGADALRQRKAWRWSKPTEHEDEIIESKRRRKELVSTGAITHIEVVLQELHEAERHLLLQQVYAEAKHEDSIGLRSAWERRTLRAMLEKLLARATKIESHGIQIELDRLAKYKQSLKGDSALGQTPSLQKQVDLVLKQACMLEAVLLVLGCQKPFLS